jgi:signal transduction histidine kinase
VAALLEEHAADLGSFFTSNPKGQKVPAYLRGLAEHMAEEHRNSLQVIEHVTRNVEHIKEIVAMQQSYARVAGVLETLPPSVLVEDALQINALALERHGVKVERDYTDVPAVTVDKHKALQVLINLIRNAKYALDDGHPPDKLLRVGIASNGSNSVRITVADNGVGIARENLTRIFSFGFTTRAGGHGFGLHSGALTAKEMGGSLTVHSDGLGHGATFTFELPISKQS